MLFYFKISFGKILTCAVKNIKNFCENTETAEWQPTEKEINVILCPHLVIALPT